MLLISYCTYTLNDIYNWKKLLFGAGSEIFSHKSRTSETKSEVRTKKVEDKLLQKDKLIAEIVQENIILKKLKWGDLKSKWTEPDHKEEVVEYTERMKKETKIGVGKLLQWLGISTSKYNSWKSQQGIPDANCSDNFIIPKSHWLEKWKKEAIINYAKNHPGEGYRRLT